VALLIGLGLGLAGCSQGGGAAGGPNQAQDSRGVITYATYQVAVVRNGDTMQTVAARVGTSPEALAQRNALPMDYSLRAGEVLLLPDDVPRNETFDTGAVETTPLPWSPEGTQAAIEGAPATTPRGGQADPLIDPVRHRVESGETAYSIARLYGVSVTELASWNGLGPDLAVRENQELLIPIVSDANRIVGSTDPNPPGQVTPVAPPPSAATPLPQDIATPSDPASPNLGAQRTPPGGRLSPPVSASVSRGYNPANPNGVAYAVPAGTPVKAAAAGEVALISEELGGMGTIVLIRHQDDLMTTYSTLSDVRVKRGDAVAAGAVIGTVAPRDQPELQFDVFRGTTAVDPTPYVGR
jgi:murein DD-endopeptidase MepM/ murein hydrolase activator NlpD